MNIIYPVSYEIELLSDGNAAAVGILLQVEMGVGPNLPIMDGKVAS